MNALHLQLVEFHLIENICRKNTMKNTRVNTHLACPSTKQKLPDTIYIKPIDQPENFQTLENLNSRSLEV